MDTVNPDSLQTIVTIIPVDVLTPNDDGVNDVLDFSLQDQFSQCTKVYVYDRWGLLIWESGNEYKWNGKIGGKKAALGIYY